MEGGLSRSACKHSGLCKCDTGGLCHTEGNTTIKAEEQGMSLEDATLPGLKMEEGHEPKNVGGL